MFAKRSGLCQLFAGQSGHLNIQMTMRYAHLAPAHKAAAVEKLSAFNAMERKRQEPVILFSRWPGETDWHHYRHRSQKCSGSGFGEYPVSALLASRCSMVGRVAQLVEQRPFKAWVAGSIPAALTTPVQLAERGAAPAPSMCSPLCPLWLRLKLTFHHSEHRGHRGRSRAM